MRCFEWMSLCHVFQVQTSTTSRLMYYNHLYYLKWRRGPFLILHEAAFIISRWEGRLSSPPLGVSVWISSGLGDKATFSSPFLHNCLSLRNTLGCWLLAAGGGKHCAHLSVLQYRRFVSRAEPFLYKVPNMQSYLHIHDDETWNGLNCGLKRNSHSLCHKRS